MRRRRSRVHRSPSTERVPQLPIHTARVAPMSSTRSPIAQPPRTWRGTINMARLLILRTGSRAPREPQAHQKWSDSIGRVRDFSERGRSTSVTTILEKMRSPETTRIRGPPTSNKQTITTDRNNRTRIKIVGASQRTRKTMRKTIAQTRGTDSGRDKDQTKPRLRKVKYQPMKHKVQSRPTSALSSRIHWRTRMLSIHKRTSRWRTWPTRPISVTCRAFTNSIRSKRCRRCKKILSDTTNSCRARPQTLSTSRPGTRTHCSSNLISRVLHCPIATQLGCS